MLANTQPLHTRTCTTEIVSRTFADIEDAREAERLVRAVSADMRAGSRGHDAKLAVARLVRIAQRATVAADPESRTRCTSHVVTGVRWTDVDGLITIGFSSGQDRIDFGQISLGLLRGEDGWRAVA